MDVAMMNTQNQYTAAINSQLMDAAQNGIDAIGIDALESLLRHKIGLYISSTVTVDGKARKGSYRLISSNTGISHDYIRKFYKKERNICIHNLNALANFFNIKYAVFNYENTVFNS